MERVDDRERERREEVEREGRKMRWVDWIDDDDEQESNGSDHSKVSRDEERPNSTSWDGIVKAESTTPTATAGDKSADRERRRETRGWSEGREGGGRQGEGERGGEGEATRRGLIWRSK